MVQRFICLLLSLGALRCNAQVAPTAVDTLVPKGQVVMAVISTAYGELKLVLYGGTPRHRANFMRLAATHALDSTTFHRVIPHFVIQGGDPNSRDDNPKNDGDGGPGYELPAELRRQYIHQRGAVGAARDGEEVNPARNSSGSQFYIVLGRMWSPAGLDSQQARVQLAQKQRFARAFQARPEHLAFAQLRLDSLHGVKPDSLLAINLRMAQLTEAAFLQEGNKPYAFTPAERKLYTTVGGTPHLDDNYTVFGQVVAGMEVAEKIAAQPRDTADRPLQNIPMQVRILRMSSKNFTKAYPGYLH